MASLSIRMLLTWTPSPSLLFACIHFSPFSSHTLIPSPSPSPSPPNPQTLLPPISLFLLTECAFSPSQISKVMKTRKSLLKTRSPHTAREALEFLKQWGFTHPQIHTIILRWPTILQCKVDTQLKPKFHFFRTLGFTDQELIKVLSFRPRAIANNLESNIIPNISFPEDLFGSKPNLIKALKKCPALLTETQWKPKLDLFKQWGIQGELLSLLLKTNPNILARYSVESLRVKIEHARSTLGIEQGSNKFVYVICAFLNNTPQTIERKMKYLQGLGLLENEVLEVLKKNPLLLTCSTNKMQENMDFLTHTAGLKPNVVFSNAILLQYSLKRRLMPRHAIFKAISSGQRSGFSMLAIFRLTERDFLQKIVECNPQASMLKEIYKGKMDFADIGTTI